MKIIKQSFVLMLAVGVLLSSLVYADRPGTKTDPRALDKPAIRSTNNFDGNRIDNDLENTGMVVSHNISGRSGMSWPAGNNTQTVYASGVWVGGKVGGEIRVTAGEYAGEFAAGPYRGFWGDPTHRIYKVNKADLADPLANFDFQNWPVEFGAPWVDNNGNGTYEPLPAGPDHPDFIGDQVLWMVSNDGDPTEHAVFGTNPLGIEMQTTIFGFDRPDAFGDMMFVKALIINKEDTPITDTYIGLWSDPDLGDAADDFVGCDTTLGLGICYNDGADHDFEGYGGGTPAVGYDFFQGPMVPAAGETAFMFGRDIPGYKNLKMTSFTKYINSDDPVWSDPNSADEAYNLMKGLMKSGAPFAANLTGGTAFVHPGDPTKDTGPADTEYVDSDVHASDDRRFLMNAGPFTMAPGDSQEVVFAIFHAAAGDALDSYLYLKEVDATAQLAYDLQFALPPSPPQPTVTVTPGEDEILLVWDSAAELYSVPDPIDKDENGDDTRYEFEGYNVYQVGTISGGGTQKLLATYDIVNGVDEVYDDVFNAQYGEIINRRVQFGSDSGIKRSYLINADALDNGNPLKTNRIYYFAVTAYGYNEYGIPKTLESSKKIFAVRPQIPNTWTSTDETALYGTPLAAAHTAGASDGAATAVVIDPTQLTGADYEIFFDYDHYYLDVDGLWKQTALPDAIAKLLDVSPTVVTGTAVVGPNGTIDLNFEVDVSSPDYNYVAGVLITVPGAVINSVSAPAGILAVIQPGGQSVLFGDTDVDGAGDFAGGEHVMINVKASSVSLPIAFSYVAYDDGWGHLVCDTDGDGVTDPDQLDYCNAYGLGPGNSVILDANGNGTITELGYNFKSFFVWKVRNTTSGDIVVPGSTIQSGVSSEHVDSGILVPGADVGVDANPIAEGIQFAVSGPALTMKSVGVYANAAGPIDPPVDGLPYWRFPDWLVADGHYDNQQTNGSIWLFNTHPAYGNAGPDVFFGSLVVYSGGLGHPMQGIGALIPYDFELRFTAAGGLAWDNWDHTGNVPVPFEWWNIGINTPDDPSDDYRLIPWLLDDNGDGVWTMNDVDDPTSGGTNDPYTDRVYVHAPVNDTPGQQGYDDFFANIAADGSNANAWYGGAGGVTGPTDTWNVMSRTILMNWNGGDVTAVPPVYNAVEPETGTVFRFITTKPNASNDKFAVATSAVVGKAVAYSPDAIKVWPNPYFGYNPEERDPLEQKIMFTHLPESGECTIRIFNLAGVPVRTLSHTNGTQFEEWDVKNNFNIPVASGMYLAVVQTDAGDKTLKLAIIQPEQRIDVY